MPVVPSSKLTIVGHQSPAQQGLKVMQQVVVDAPEAALPGSGPRAMAHLIATHLLHMILGAGLLNVHGHHSAAVALFRDLEDALDCLLAVARVKGAADKWETNKLKPSDAAKLVENLGVRSSQLRTGVTITWGEYRKALRDSFNKVSHCCYPLTQYNIALVPHGDKYRIFVNLPGTVIEPNAHQIDAFLMAHTLESLEAFLESFPGYFRANPPLENDAQSALEGMREVMEGHMTANCLEVWPPAEIRSVKI